MEKNIKKLDYISPSIETVELVLEGAVLQNSPGGVGGGGINPDGDIDE